MNYEKPKLRLNEFDEFDRASTSNLRRQRHFEMRVSIHEFSFVT